MAIASIDDYLASVPEPARTSLSRLRGQLRALLPNAEEGISYGVPAFMLSGKAVAGFMASKGHLTYLPHSGAVLDTIKGDLEGYSYGKGSLRFSLDGTLPGDLLARLVDARLAELGLTR